MDDQKPLVPRPTKGCEKPFAWVSKRAMDRIAKSEGEISVFILRSAYLALAEIASDEESPTFQKFKKYIGKRAGLGKRKTSDVLDELEQCGVIAIKRGEQIEGTKAKDANVYTLLAMNPDRAKGDAQKTLACGTETNTSDAPTCGTETSASCARKEKNTPKGVLKKNALVAEAIQSLGL